MSIYKKTAVGVYKMYMTTAVYFCEAEYKPQFHAKLRFFNKTGLNSLCAYPHTLYLSVCKTNAYALNIGLEYAIVLLYELQTDTATFLALTFMDNNATLYRTLTCN